MYSVDESLAKLSKSRVFSKLDANSGFWQLPRHSRQGAPPTYNLHHTIQLLLF